MCVRACVRVCLSIARVYACDVCLYLLGYSPFVKRECAVPTVRGELLCRFDSKIIMDMSKNIRTKV